MLKADENAIDELTSMSSSSNQHFNGGKGALAVEAAVYIQERPLLTQKSSVPTSFVRDYSLWWPKSQTSVLMEGMERGLVFGNPSSASFELGNVQGCSEGFIIFAKKRLRIFTIAFSRISHDFLLKIKGFCQKCTGF